VVAASVAGARDTVAGRCAESDAGDGAAGTSCAGVERTIAVVAFRAGSSTARPAATAASARPDGGTAACGSDESLRWKRHGDEGSAGCQNAADQCGAPRIGQERNGAAGECRTRDTRAFRVIAFRCGIT
jgi:hypothetical protein